MHGRCQPGTGDAAHKAPLQGIFAVENNDGCPRQRGRIHPGMKVARGKLRRGNGLVAHGTQRLHRAALHRHAVGCDHAQHRAVAQQIQGVVLVVHPHIEQVAMLLVQLRQRTQHPGVQRIAIDRNRDGAQGCAGVVCVFFWQEVGQGLGLQQLHRAHAAQQQRPGRRGAAGWLAHQQHLPQPVFQRLDALGYGRRGHAQPPGGRFKAAFFQHGGKGGQLGVEQIHGGVFGRLDFLDGMKNF